MTKFVFISRRLSHVLLVKGVESDYKSFFNVFFYHEIILKSKISCICCNIDDWKFFNVRSMTLIASSETLCVSAAVHSVVLQGKVVIYLNWHTYIILIMISAKVYPWLHVYLFTLQIYTVIDMSAKLKKTIKEKIQDIKDQRDVIVAFLNEFVSEVKSFYLLYHYNCIMTIYKVFLNTRVFTNYSCFSSCCSSLTSLPVWKKNI